MKDSVYVTLSSNVDPTFYPDNTLTHFLNKLPQEIDLNDGGWEVGLTELSIPFSWLNVQSNEITINLRWKREESLHELYGTDKSDHLSETLTLPPGHYPTAQQLIDRLNTMLQKCEHEVFRGNVYFFYDHITQKVTFEGRNDVDASFSTKLLRMLGVLNVTSDVYLEKFVGDDVVDVADGVHNLYIYSNVVEHRPVGRMMVPLLRIIPVVDSAGNVTKNHAFESVHYLDARRGVFESIEIDIRTVAGESVPFQRGEIIATLHFRKPQ